MGNTSSSSSGGVTSFKTTPISRDELYKQTNEYRTLLNDIFNYMMHEIKINDFLQLSTESGCKKYVLFMANNLQYFFHQMKVDITRDKHGILAFRRISDLETPTDEAKTQKQTLCTVLAYYYTRIFQIYGAIVLTTVDDVSDMMKLITPPPTNKIYKMLPPPGHQVEMVTQKKTLFVGGAFPNNWGILQFIHPYLSIKPGFQEYIKDKQFAYGYVTQYHGKGKNDIVYFKPDVEQIDERGRPLKLEKNKRTALFTISLPSHNDSLSFVEIEAEEDNGKIFCRIVSVKYYRKGGTNLITEYIIPGKKITEILTNNDIRYQLTLIPNQFNQSSITSYTIEGINQSIEEYFDNLFSKIIPYIRTQSDERPSRIINSTIEGMQLSKTIDAIEKEPQARCISRANQLLRQVAFGKTPAEQKFVSTICKKTFFKNPKEESRKDIPLPGHPLSESKGLQATVLLFFDTITSASPHVTMSDVAFKEYRAFMLKLTALHEGTAAMQQKSQVQKITLNNIKNDMTEQHVCSGEYKDKEIELDFNQASKVHPYVLALFDIQAKHIVECDKILRELFYIKRIGPNQVQVSLSEAIMKGGISVLNQIVIKVRRLLVNYFINCDYTYIHGEDALLEEIHKKKKIEEDKRKIVQNASKAKVAVAESPATNQTKAASKASPAPNPVVGLIRVDEKNIPSKIKNIAFLLLARDNSSIKLFLVKEKDNSWSTPGGQRGTTNNPNELPWDAGCREFLEETDKTFINKEREAVSIFTTKIKNYKMLVRYIYNNHTCIYVMQVEYNNTIYNGPTNETIDGRWININEIDKLSLKAGTSGSLPLILKDMKLI